MDLSSIDKIILPGLFTSQEKQSLYQVMCAVRKIGAHQMESKEQHIHEVMSATGITGTHQAQSRLLTQPQMIGVLKQMEASKKLYFAKFVSITSLIGGPSEKETMFIN